MTPIFLELLVASPFSSESVPRGVSLCAESTTQETRLVFALVLCAAPFVEARLRTPSGSLTWRCERLGLGSLGRG